MPSIKVLNIVLVLLCIVITAFICTFLAISSSNVALDDTKESRDTSVASAFAVGEESVQNRTDEYLEYLLTSTTDFLMQFLKPQREVSSEMANNLEANSWDDIKRWEWHRLESYHWKFFYVRKDGTTAIGVSLKNHLVIIPYEDVLTVNNTPSEYHAIKLLYNYGDEHPWGGINKTFHVSVDLKTGQPQGVSSFSDFNYDTHNCEKNQVATKGAVPDEPCYTDTFGDNTQSTVYRSAANFPPGTTLWTPPVNLDEYLVTTAFTPIYHNGAYSGVSYAAADLRYISRFLKQVQVSGPVEGHPSRGRVFITVRSSFMDPRAAGLILGSSHGVVVLYPDPSKPKLPSPIRPEHSSDSIVRQVGTAEVNVESLATGRNTTTLNITTDLAPGGEDFYYRVGIMADTHGIDWYLHVVIDRAYILGSIDRKTAETKDAIHTAEKKVDDDLASMRQIQYIVVSVVAVGLIVVSVMFVWKIIEPLVVLEKEMAMVAVMRLDMVDTERPMSSLQEVRLMQASFLQMMKNLVEYRNYMPASVLQDTEDEDNESESSKTDSHPRASLSNSSNSHLPSAARNYQNTLHGTEAKLKKVTLMTCNIVSFLNDTSRVLDTIAHYLTMSLAEVRNTKGIPDSFNGDRLYVSWNGVRPCASHRTQAYTCSRAISGDTSLGKKFSIGIASGEVKCGNMGCEGMKKFSFIGSLASWVHVVERVGRLRRADIAICCATHEELVNVAYVRSIQHVLFTKHSLRTLMIYEAGKKREVVEEEWMYQLEQGASNDPNKIFNTSYELFMNGDVEGAAAMLQQSTYDMESDVAIKYKERLEAAASDPSLCEPYGKRDPIMS